MTTSEWISVVALMVSSGALALQIRGWLASGPRLHLSVIADALEFPRGDGKPKLALFVTNRGDEPTTLTHMVVFVYRSQWRRFKRKKDFSAIVNSPAIPAEIGINKTWNGMMLYDKEANEARARDHLYVGVFASHSDREFLVRVPPKQNKEIPKQQMASG